MQLCPHCQLSNLDHLQQCVRCGTALRHAAPVTETTPPRAGRLGKWRNPFYRWRRRRGFLHWASAAPEKPQGQIVCFRTAMQTVLDHLLPGLYHRRIGRKIMAGIYLIGTAVLLLGLVLSLGTVAFNWFLLAMTLLQCASICDQHTFPELPLTRQRIAASVMLSLVLFWVLSELYQTGLPRLLRSFALIPANAAFAGPDIHANNLLRLQEQPAYHRGDLVQFDADVIQYGRETRWNRNRRDRALTIDRILAEPGDYVEWKDGKIYLNRQTSPSEILPLTPTELQIPTDPFLLGRDEYLICPTVGVRNWQRNFSRVPARQLRGKITAVVLPIWHAKRL